MLTGQFVGFVRSTEIDPMLPRRRVLLDQYKASQETACRNDSKADTASPRLCTK